MNLVIVTSEEIALRFSVLVKLPNYSWNLWSYLLESNCVHVTRTDNKLNCGSSKSCHMSIDNLHGLSMDGQK